MSGFVHLHNHTHYSILDAISTPKSLIKAAVDDGMEAIAITDHGVMFGALEFYQEAKKQGIKPILGVEAYMATGSMHDKTALKEKTKNYFHIVLLAKNLKGYQNLIKLVSLAFTEGFYQKPRIDRELLEQYAEGIICTSACIGGVVGDHVVSQDMAAAREAAEWYKRVFGDDFYLEIQDHGLPQDKFILENVPKLAKELGVKLICSNDIHYDKKENAVAHNIHLLIQNVSPQNAADIDIKDLRYQVPEFYFKTSEQMKELFKDYPDAIENTVEIARKCDLELDFKTNHTPIFPIPETSKAETLSEYLKEVAEEGLRKLKGDDATEEYWTRLEYELGIIEKMGFPGYFLIVMDFIHAALEMGISVGPGRGSAAGSLVAYALEITKVDPLEYDLLFERFLNPFRQSMPDVDIDFDDRRREEVIAYVRDKYGEEAVSMIITYNKLSSKQVLTDVGRVLNVPLNVIKQLTPTIPVIFGRVTKLAEAIELQQFKEELDKIKANPMFANVRIDELLEYSLQLEDRVRSTGIHAAGVVIAPSDVTNYCPVYKPPSGKSGGALSLATQYDMKRLEDAGLLKMDFLGLKTLSIIKDVLDQVKENYDKEIDIDKIDLSDEKTLKSIFSEGKTLAVFQFESSGMRAYLKQLKPDSLEEIVAMNALYRPGPMSNIPSFIDRKFGREPINLISEVMRPSLEKTYGIIVYQEQVMRLVQDLAGFNLGEADLLRRAMGKKDKEKMAESLPKFIEGCAKNGIGKKDAMEIWELIKRFADYGFNKSHAVAYSIVAFQTAWLKAHYPAEFYAANMSAEINDHAKIYELKQEAREFGITLLPPDVNNSNLRFTARGKQIYFGMSAIKGIGTAVVEEIIEKREKGQFLDFVDFVGRVDYNVRTKRAMEPLIGSGAFDSIIGDENRATLLATVEDALHYAKAFQSVDNESSLFGGSTEVIISKPSFRSMPDMDDNSRLFMEKSYIGYFVSGHPLEKYIPAIQSFNTSITKKEESDDGRAVQYNEYICTTSKKEDFIWHVGEGDPNSISEYQKRASQNKVVICGLVSSMRKLLSKKDGRTLAFVRLEDFKGSCELKFWADAYAKSAEALSENNIIVVFGRVDSGEDEFSVVAEKAVSIDKAIEELGSGFKLWLEESQVTEGSPEAKALKDIEKNEKEIEVRFAIDTNGSGIGEVNYIAKMKKAMKIESLQSLYDALGESNVLMLWDSSKENIEKYVSE
ncbi:MAG: DNA polymerase III subunit alpha [Candidatus Kapaibacteriales bacterium]